jgi:type II secretory pathway component PulF
MPIFSYKARISPTQLQEGSLEAENKEQALKKISDLGLFPIDVWPQQALGKKSFLNIFRLSHKIKRQEIISFTRQLASLLESGLNILPALNVLKGQAISSSLRQLLDDISTNVQEGAAFSEALSSHEHIFSPLYINVIRSGELSGKLTPVLDTLADFLESQEDLRQRIITALVYPLLVLAIGILTVSILLIVVIPRIGRMYQDMGQVLPVPTQIVVGVSNLLARYFWLISVLIAVFVFTVKRNLQTKEGKVFFDRLSISLPILGVFIKEQHIVQFSRTLSLLLGSGIPIVTSLELASATLSNRMIKTEIERMALQIREGESLSTVLKLSQFFPAYVANVISVAEESGTLERSLNRIASSFEREVERIIKRFSATLEPMLIFFIGIIVGFIVISMLLPIFQINLIIG